MKRFFQVGHRIKRAQKVLIVSILLQAVFVFADEATSLFHQANSFYEKGEFSQAVSLYNEIIASGKENWQIYYNLANAHYRLNEIGRAILNYERALKLSPDNEDVQFNLEIAQLAVVDRIAEPPKDAWIRFVEALFLAPRLNLVIWVAVFAYAAFMIFLSVRFFAPRLTRNFVYRAVVNVSLAIVVITLSMAAFRWYKAATDRHGVVLQEEVQIKSEPSETGTEVFLLHEGTRFEIQEIAGDWAEIRLRDGKVGWLLVKSFEMI